MHIDETNVHDTNLFFDTLVKKEPPLFLEVVDDFSCFIFGIVDSLSLLVFGAKIQ